VAHRENDDEVGSLMTNTSNDLFAIRVIDDSMAEAYITKGDIVIIQHTQQWKDGDVVAVWLKDSAETNIKRIYGEPDYSIRLEAINRTNPSTHVLPKDIDIEGKVIAVIRNMEYHL
jgi:repressor LexA